MDKWTKYKRTMVEKLGSEEAYLAFIKARGSKGGSKPVLKGWIKRKADIKAGIKVKPLNVE